MTGPARRELLGVSIFVALAGTGAVAVAKPDPMQDEGHCWTAIEAELLYIYRSRSPSERTAMLRMLERTAGGDDMHAIGAEFLMACGFEEDDARARTAAVLEQRGQS